MKTQSHNATCAQQLGSFRIRQRRHPSFQRLGRHLAAILALLASAGLPCVEAADPPHLIPFQGHLARPTASDPTQFEPVPAGRYDILFTLYAAPVGGESKVWGPERHAQVTVINGLVNAMLGSVIGFQEAIAANLNFFARPLYVGITIDADGNPNTADLELVPRQVLLPSVYALNANKLDGYDWHDVFSNGDPTGTILSERIADQSITAQKIAPQTLTAGQVAPQTLTAQQIAQETITTQQLANHSVTAGKILPQTITANELAPETITSQQIHDGTITEADLHPSLTINSIIPPGTISAFGGPDSSIPSGWLPCNGAAVRTNDYPALFAAIGTSWWVGSAASDDFSLPDLRAMFLRGVNGGLTDATWKDPNAGGRQARYGGNVGDAVGSYQPQEFKSHNHQIPVESGGSLNEQSLASNIGSDEGLSSGSIRYSGGSETRPNNACVNFIIKY